MTAYDLKLADGTVATWDGSDGIDAATRYVDVFRDATVLAWREANYHGIHVGAGRIVGPNGKDSA